MSLLRPEIESMSGYTPGFQPVGDEYIKLNTNENPEPPSASVLGAIRDAVGPSLRRYPDPVAAAVRERAAEVYGVEPEQVIVGNGSDDILTLIVRAVVGQGQTIAAPYPTYTLYETLAAIQGARFAWVPFPDDFSLPAAALAAAGARLIFVATPNSPTGTVIPCRDLAELADRFDGVLVIDEAYADFAETNCLDLARTRPNCLVLRSLSKSYALAGVRVGLGLGPRALIDGLLKVKDSYNVNRLSQAAALAALSDQEGLRGRVARIVAERRRVTEALERMGLVVPPSQANFVFARFTQPAAKDAQEALRARNILVRHFDRPRTDDGLRITIGTPEQNDALLAALRDIVNP